MALGIWDNKRTGTLFLLLAFVAVEIFLPVALQVDALPAVTLILIICLEIISATCIIPPRTVSAGYRFGIPPRSPPIC